MTEPPYYPPNWDRIAERLKSEVGRCENCKKDRREAQLEVHHVVPVSRGGSHLENNLKVLCSRCHDAAHPEKTDEMAPVIEFYTGWEIPGEDFEVFRSWLRKSPMRPHGEDGYYIPLGEIREELSEMEEVEELTQEELVSSLSPE